MAQIIRRVNAMNNVQKAIVELAGIPAAAPHLIEAITSLREVRKELAYEIFRDDYEDGVMSDEEKKRRCEVAYNRGYAEMLASPDNPRPSRCDVAGVEYIHCRDCPLYRGTT